MTNVKEQLNRMYVGFVCVYWSNGQTKLGTAKQKSIQQIKSFANTIDKSGPVAAKIQSDVQQISRAVSRQIMTDKSSEMVLDKKQSAQYRAFGEKQIAAAKQALGVNMARGNMTLSNAAQKSHATKSTLIAQIRDMQNKSRTQDMITKQNAPQYRAHKTNVPGKGAKPAVTLQKLDQQKWLQMFAYNRYQKTA